MATRRPSVPKAQFTSGLSGAQEAAPVEAIPTNPKNLPASGSGDRAATQKGAEKGAAKGERKLASDAQSRSRQDGVVHASGNSPVPARSFSGRLLVMALTMGVATVLLAPNVHTFLTQRTEISQLQDDISARQAQQEAYAAEIKRWDDPAYIKQQARDRVSMLMPGETGYWVYGANGTETIKDSVDAAKAAAAQATTAKKATEITTEPWVDGLWDAVKKSAQVQVPVAAVPDKPATTPAPSPSTAP